MPEIKCDKFHWIEARWTRRVAVVKISICFAAKVYSAPKFVLRILQVIVQMCRNGQRMMRAGAWPWIARKFDAQAHRII